MRYTTLCYIENPAGEYLMLHRVKKENDCNRGKWIGIGGKFEDGESPEECALREIREETGLTVTGYRYRGIVTFVSDRWETEYMHLFTADGFEGEIRTCSPLMRGPAASGTTAARACWSGSIRTGWRPCPSGPGTGYSWTCCGGMCHSFL